MPFLIKDILVDVGKEVVEGGDQCKVYLFGLSGQQPFEALKGVFSSINYLELYDDHYVVGWGKGSCSFEFSSDKPHSKTLMNCIGNAVQHLSINCSIGDFYATILNNIIQSKKLISLSIKKEGGFQNFWNLVKACPTTLKQLSAPKRFMKRGKSATKFLNLDSLKFFGKFCPGQLSCCCKTTKLIVSDDYMMDGLYMNNKAVKKNSNLSFIKVAVFNITTLQGHLSCYDPNGVMQLLPSLQDLTFNTSFVKCNVPIENDIQGDSLFEIFEFQVDNTHFIYNPFRLPQKLTYVYQKAFRPMVVKIIGAEHGYEYDNSESDFYCYFQTLEWNEKEIALKVKIEK